MATGWFRRPQSATLQACLFALGHPAAYSTAFIAMLGASILAALAPIPLGLGSFEAGAIGMLSLLGIAVPAALAGTPLPRGFTLWLPLLPGLVLMRLSSGNTRSDEQMDVEAE